MDDQTPAPSRQVAGGDGDIDRVAEAGFSHTVHFLQTYLSHVYCKREQVKCAKLRIPINYFERCGGERAICYDCSVRPRLGIEKDLAKLHAELSPGCEFVKRLRKSNKTRKESEALLDADNTDDGVAQVPRQSTIAEPSTRQSSIIRQETDRSPGHQGPHGWPSARRNKAYCNVCKDAISCVMFMPCRHVYACLKCAENENTCIKCGLKVEKKENFYRS